MTKSKTKNPERNFTVDAVYNDIFYHWSEEDFEKLLRRLKRTTNFECFDAILVQPFGD